MTAWLVGLLLGVVPVVALAQNGSPAEAQEAVAETPLVRVQVEFIETSQEAMTRLLAAPRASLDDSDLRKAVGELVGKGEATVVETLLCTGRSGIKFVSSSFIERIYPTEWDPPVLPKEPDSSDSEKAPEKAPEKAGDAAVPPIPHAWETRNVGSNLEAEATVEGRLISLGLAPEMVYHVGNDTWFEWKDAHGTTALAMPKFYSLKFVTQVHLLPGKPVLVAALSPQGKDGMVDGKRKVLVFARCDVLGQP